MSYFSRYLKCKFRMFKQSFSTSESERLFEVNKALLSVCEPTVNKPLVSFGGISNIRVVDETVIVDVNLLVPGYPHLEKIKKSCTEAISKLPWVESTVVSFPNMSRDVKFPKGEIDSKANIVGIKNIIAVSSCKGGVGKSTIAVNLALALAKKGLRVGLLDADLYGPSLPYMVRPLSDTVRRSQTNRNNILPLDGPYGIKMLSFGHVSPSAGVQGAGGVEAAVLRGPVASKVITQMVMSTEWGQLDYMIVDMPPGTGDIQITLSQSLNFIGTVVVTTPHTLSLADAAKGIAMFQQLRVPTLALVENMSYFVCRHGEKYYPFGEGGRANILKGLRMPVLAAQSASQTSTTSKGPSPLDRLEVCPLHTLPLSPSIATTAKDGVTNNSFNPLEVEEVYNALADDVILEIFRIKIDAFSLPTITYREDKDEVVLRDITSESVTEYRIPAMELRIRDPVTGQVFTSLDKADKTKYAGARPLYFDLKGNYGVAINWSDGHFADIFPFEMLRRISNELKGKFKVQ